MTRAHPHIQAMAPYALAPINVPDGVPFIALAQNESLRPPSPAVAKALAAWAGGGALYPDPDWTALRQALAGLHKLPVDGILCGAGSLDLIGALARVYAGPDRAVLIPAHAYPFFRTAAHMTAARVDTAPERDATVSVEALLDAVHPDTGLVFVANPGNPTGTRIPTAELRRLRAGLRDDILLVIDEAYGEFTDGSDAPTWDLVEGGNTVVLRTFSKAYGLAGFRVGWGLFPRPIAAEMRKVMNPNNLSAPSQIAAQAALEDQAYMRETCAETAKGRTRVYDALANAGFDIVPSVTNFLLIRFADEAEALAVDATLTAQGIVLRRQAGAALPHALRMTIGEDAACQTAIDALCRWKMGVLT